jgi:hypothetical protein
MLHLQCIRKDKRYKIEFCSDRFHASKVKKTQSKGVHCQDRKQECNVVIPENSQVADNAIKATGSSGILPIHVIVI